MEVLFQRARGSAWGRGSFEWPLRARGSLELALTSWPFCTFFKRMCRKKKKKKKNVQQLNIGVCGREFWAEEEALGKVSKARVQCVFDMGRQEGA